MPLFYSISQGLLDIYGFEAFESNSLEQLCINYANEKLQQHYVKHFLKDLQQEYEEECISWEALAYTDNQACLQILEGNCSVFTILNEDIQLNRQTDTVQLCERVLSLCRTSQFLKKPRHYMKEPGFSVKHYAGEVTYSMDQLSTKNRDSIPPEIVSMLANSSNQFISSLFSEMDIEEGTGKRRKTVLGKFKASLDGLMSSLGSSDVHYIRCIKPNTKSLPGLFDCQYVMSQLVAGGIIETVRICSLGYPVRMAYSEFLHRYGMILRNSPTPPSSQSSVDNDILYEPLDTLYMKQLDMFHNSPQKHNTPKKRLRRRAGLSNCDQLRRCSAAVLAILYGDCKGLTGQFGRTKLFLHQHQVDRLEERRYTILCMKASIIQRYWRAHHRRQRLSVIHLSVSARVIQAAWRSYVQHKLSKAVLVMQKWFRMHMCRKQYKRLQEQRQKACKEAKRKQASWKPIMDRKRTSSGSKRSKTSSRSSSRVHSADSSRGVSDSSGILSSDNSSLMDSDQHMDVSEECKASPFSTSTPKSTSAVHMFSADSDGILAGQKENVSPSKRKALMPRGRPNFRRSPQTKFKLKRKHCSSNNGNRIEHSGMSPVKKMKTPYGYKVTQEDGLNVGDGIITRRKLPSGPVRFHTRASVLKHAHKLHHKELVKGLLDCLPHTPIK
ncbi:hypothetical protein DPMN_001261 [Dreissena polymorpha]|uniref:Myosin motor domain-containing protein n=1 Tax=Dreissena polymorpha TaxID=45954 RepID=A0A9D4RQ79_DREPO|nr:hypothetical protein DPMN_001261 [Dreissena polymorpha]